MSKAKGLVETVKGWFGEPPTLDAIRAEREAAQEAADREELARRTAAHTQARAAAEQRERDMSELEALRKSTAWPTASEAITMHTEALADGHRALAKVLTTLDAQAARLVADNVRARELAANLGQSAPPALTFGMLRAAMLESLSRDLGNAGSVNSQWLELAVGEELARRIVALFDAGRVEAPPEEHAARLIESGDPRIVTREEQFKKREQTRWHQAQLAQRERLHLESFERQQRGIGGVQ